MSYASRSGRARTSAKKPSAFAVCDRCGIWYNFIDLQWQYDWRGPVVQNIRLLVCKRCLDIPQEQLRAVVLPADPVPIMNARTEDFDAAETDYRTLSAPTVRDPMTGLPVPGTTLRITQDDENRTIEPFGRPVGFNQNAVMPLEGITHYGVPLQLISVTSDGTATVTVTCSAVHNLQNDSQVSVDGLSNAYSNGFYSVTVLTATAFTYMTYSDNPQGSLLTPGTRIITAHAGLPRGY